MRENQKKSHSDFHMIQGLAEALPLRSRIEKNRKRKTEKIKDENKRDLYLKCLFDAFLLPLVQMPLLS